MKGIPAIRKPFSNKRLKLEVGLDGYDFPKNVNMTVTKKPSGKRQTASCVY